MKCRFQSEIGDADRVGCSVPDISDEGIVPRAFCGACPVFEELQTEFFAATNQLWVSQQRSGAYKPAPRGCGGCGEVKRREDQQQSLQFVWPYWHAGAISDEIRWSVRSVETFFEGSAHCTIIGDKPPWYNGHYIPQHRVHKRTPNRAFRDMLAKMLTLAEHDEISNEFIWMMDDIYFLQPVTLEDLKTPRATKWRGGDGNSWQKRKTNTMQALQAAGRPNHDYATHLPHHVEKGKLAQLFAEFNLTTNTMLWEVLYGNSFRDAPQSVRPFFRRIVKSMSPEQVAAAVDGASIMNHTSSAWCPAVRELLESRLPKPATSESDEPYVPSFRVTNRTAAPVKRRPKHTHRAVIERQATAQ